MTDTKLNVTKTLPPIPSYLLQPEDWAVEATKRAAEYAGMPEGTWFLVEARRYMALAAEIKGLNEELASLRQIV